MSLLHIRLFHKLVFKSWRNLGTNHFEGRNSSFCLLCDQEGTNRHIFPVEVVTEVRPVVRVVILELILFSNMLTVL